MKILIAPDKFKGALSAREVAENIAKGIRDVLPDASIEIMPVADGGEGTAEVIAEALGGEWIACKAHDPLGREIDARYAWVDNRKLSVMEMSEAAGMRRLRPNEYDIDRANTFGVGEMILDAAKRGAQEIIIGLGGSATNDGGFGMARALGYRFLGSATGDELDCLKPSSLQELRGAVSEVVRLVRIEKQERLSLPRIIAAVDVQNPLLGENGATRVFGPQKGAKPEQIQELELALGRLADIVEQEFGSRYRDVPGAGAAGGLGFGVMSFCHGKVTPGFDVVAELTGLEAKIQEADVVITGEGSLDRQTLQGKTPAGVARMARKLRKRVFALVGRAGKDAEVSSLFDGVYENAQPNMTVEENMSRAAEFLQANARSLAKVL